MFLILKRNKFWSKTGISIIEILIVVAIIAIAFVSLFSLSSLSLKASILTKQTIKADFWAQEEIEAIRSFRDRTTWATDGIGSLTMGIDYYPQKTGNPLSWNLATGTETADGFTRKVVFSNVQRDGNGNIVEGGGVNDPQTKKITATVNWQERGVAHQVEIAAYLTNWNK